MDTLQKQQWSIKITHYSEESPEDMLGSPFNWRRHAACQQNAMVSLLSDLGWLSPIVVNETTGAIINGHMRTELALRHGIPRIPVAWVTLSEADEKKAILTFDSIGDMASADTDALAALIHDPDTNTSDAALMQMLSALAQDHGIVPPDFVPAGIEQQGRLDQKKPIVCPHCGESFTV